MEWTTQCINSSHRTITLKFLCVHCKKIKMHGKHFHVFRIHSICVKSVSGCVYNRPEHFARPTSTTEQICLRNRATRCGLSCPRPRLQTSQPSPRARGPRVWLSCLRPRCGTTSPHRGLYSYYNIDIVISVLHMTAFRGSRRVKHITRRF